MKGVVHDSSLDRIGCYMCKEYRPVSANVSNEEPRPFCDLRYENLKCQSYSKWSEHINERHGSCLVCHNSFHCRLNFFNHDCLNENHFCCSFCFVIFDSKCDIIKHVRNCCQTIQSLIRKSKIYNLPSVLKSYSCSDKIENP